MKIKKDKDQLAQHDMKKDWKGPKKKKKDEMSKGEIINEVIYLYGTLVKMIDKDLALKKHYVNRGAFLDGNKTETIEIGKRLYELNGHDLMVAMHQSVQQQVGIKHSAYLRELELCWHGIGEWRG